MGSQEFIGVLTEKYKTWKLRAEEAKAPTASEHVLSTSSGGSMKPAKFKDRISDSIVCWHCGKTGHLQKDCLVKDKSPCRKCGSYWCPPDECKDEKRKRKKKEAKDKGRKAKKARTEKVNMASTEMDTSHEMVFDSVIETTNPSMEIDDSGELRESASVLIEEE
ncbi:hypothetical protein H0H93_002044, partial [Arthromyces matolae]